MKHIKNSLVVFAVVLAVTAVGTFFIPSFTHGQPPTTAQKDVKVINSPSEPVPVTGTVSVGNVVGFHPVIPAGAFSVSRFGEAIVSGPDPAGTSYAITSLTIANTNESASAGLTISGAWGDDCVFAFSPAGIFVPVPAGDTIHLSFPQPFVLSAQPGAVSCLKGSSSIHYTVIGYRF
jgi:hypothetical protein